MSKKSISKNPDKISIAVPAYKCAFCNTPDTRRMILRRIMALHRGISELQALGAFEALLQCGAFVEAGYIGINSGSDSVMSYCLSAEKSDSSVVVNVDRQTPGAI